MVVDDKRRKDYKRIEAVGEELELLIANGTAAAAAIEGSSKNSFFCSPRALASSCTAATDITATAIFSANGNILSKTTMAAIKTVSTIPDKTRCTMVKFTFPS